MLLGTLGASLLGNLLTGKNKLEKARTFNTASSVNKFINTKVLSKWTKI